MILIKVNLISRAHVNTQEEITKILTWHKNTKFMAWPLNYIKYHQNQFTFTNTIRPILASHVKTAAIYRLKK